MAKILLVEDDSFLNITLKDNLQREGYLVDSSESGDEALRFLDAFEYDLLILDWQLPGKSGVEICKLYRIKCTGPVLLVTGLSSIDNKVEGFEAGVDDYLCKPFDMREFLIRVAALLRRASSVSGTKFEIADLLIDLQSRRVFKQGKDLELSPREFEVLEFFVKNQNVVVTTETLLRRVWGSDSEASSHSVYSCLNRLRKNLNSQNKEALIKTVHGFGYRLETK